MEYVNCFIKHFLIFIGAVWCYIYFFDKDKVIYTKLGKMFYFLIIQSFLYGMLIITYKIDYYILIIILCIFDSILMNQIIRANFLKTFLLFSLSFVISLTLYFIVGMLFVMPISCMLLNNDTPSFIDSRIGEFLYLLVLFKFLNFKKFKYGLNSIQENNLKSSAVPILIFLVIVCSFSFLGEIFYVNYNNFIFVYNSLFVLIILSILLLIIWFKRELDNHYKNKANEQTIENLSKMVEEQKAEIDRLTKVSKISHKTNHQIDLLKSKIETSDKVELRKELNELSNNYRDSINKINKKTLLQSTKIKEIDEVLEYFLNECYEKKIDFVVKINGSINYMVKNYITIDELKTLLSDHLKNSIISINHSNNPFRSITIMLGEIGDYYGIVIYDTGIEFKINTLVNLGLKAVTTHKKDGGTGIGFLTTFETMNKTKASLFINEKKPADYNYTKSISIIFDDLNEYRVNSYRKNIISEKNKNNKIVLTNKNNI